MRIPATTVRRIALASALVICLVAAFTVMRLSHGDVIDSVWYYDLNAGKLFTGPYAAAPPIAAPSGDYRGADAEDLDHLAGVVAIVVRPKAGGTAGSSDKQIVYLQRYTRETRPLRQRQMADERLAPDEEGKVLGGLRVAVPPEQPDQTVTWHTLGSREGKSIMARYDQLMGSGKVELDLPGD